MTPRVAAGTALGVIAVALALMWRGAEQPIAEPVHPVGVDRAENEPADSSARPAAASDALERRIARLESRLDAEARRAEHLQQQLEQMATALASANEEAATAGPNGTDHAAATVSPPAPFIEGSGGSALERALQAAGLDAATAEDIKRRGDQFAMTEMYLHDQATREGWVDTPRFQEEMDAIEQQRTSIRDEIGDDAYDRYLFAMGRTNRIIVNDVMFQSVAEEVGLEAGDLIVRYDDALLFAPDELVSQTHTGPAGETVTLEVVRDGKRLEVQVPRGPLGLRIGPTQDYPDRRLGTGPGG
jgi:membrane-associated protease RseP (regulator of RpoE activity)